MVNVCDADVEKFCVKDAEKLRREWAAGKGPGGVSKHGILGRAAADASVGEVCASLTKLCAPALCCSAILPCIARQVMHEASCCNMTRKCLGQSEGIQTGRCREGCCVRKTECGLHLWLAHVACQPFRVLVCRCDGVWRSTRRWSSTMAAWTRC